jgi:hypothetical protein
MNEQNFHESYRPQINQPNNQRHMLSYPPSNQIIPNNNHPINDGYDNLGLFIQAPFNNESHYFNPQNHANLVPNTNYPHQHNRYEPTNHRTNGG